MNIDFMQWRWINKPGSHRVGHDSVDIITEPETDFWQRSYYGFRNDNAPAFLLDSDKNFTFTTQVRFDYRKQFDQCGVILYIDSQNWFKASVEYENKEFSRLGSVVTNLGYSDWATTDIMTPPLIWYRLSRRGPDFMIESSFEGRDFRQMRIFHLHTQGETTADMGVHDSPEPSKTPVSFGIYACSPLNSSFRASFSHFTLGESIWKAHHAE